MTNTSHPTVHICRGTGRNYVVRLRSPYQRKCRLISKHKTYEAAIKRLAKEMAVLSGHGRGDVLLCADYYDPTVIFEMIKR